MGNLASAVDELLAVDVREASAAQLQEELDDIVRQRRRLDAAYATRVEALDRRGLVPEEFGSTQAWLRGTFRLSPTQAHRDVGLGRDLADVLPLTTAALADGDISVDHAQLIASLRRVLTDFALGEVENHLVALAREHNPKDLARAIAYVKHAYAPDRGLKDEQDLHRERTLSLASTFDGAGVGRWTLPPASQETVATAIHAASAPEADDARTAEQRRADALVTVCEIALRSGDLPLTGGVKPHVSIVVRADVIAEPMQPRPLPEELFADLDTIEAELRRRVVQTSFGSVISPTWARRFLCDAAASRIVMNGGSEVLDAGRTTRTFTAAQTRAIVARDVHCIWPGCDAPAAWCEAHHVHHWADGGVTSVDNGVLLCGRHHDRVHLYGHAIVSSPSGRRRVDVRKGTDPRWRGSLSRAGP